MDGVISDPAAWAMSYFDQEAQREALKRLMISDAMLMGRLTYQALSAAWSSRSGGFAERINAIPKYVFSSTLETAAWNNATIVRGDPAQAVARLKQEGEGDLTIFGHGPLGRALLANGLLDEIRLFLHPVLVGRGTLFFAEAETRRLDLISVTTMSNGVVVVVYRPAAPTDEA